MENMEKYDYMKAMIADIKDYIEDNEINVENYELYELNDMLWDEDNVTGNKTGYDSAAKCEEYLAGNLKLYLEAQDEFLMDSICDFSIPADKRILYMDTTIRCYLLLEAIQAYLNTCGRKCKEENDDC